MNTGSWFELRFRDNTYLKYLLQVSDIQIVDEGSLVVVRVVHNNTNVATIKIVFHLMWIINNCYSNNTNRKSTKLEKRHIGDDKYSTLIANLIKDFIFGKPITHLNNQVIDINESSVYVRNILRNESGVLYYQRDPIIVAKENRFAREIVLRELYNIHSGRGPSSINYIIEKCNFYAEAIHNAVEALKDRQFIQPSNSDTLKLSYSGQTFVEDKLLSPFNDKIFLIAACDKEIDPLIDEVYRPAVDELGYELKFQERSEPKGTIHDDIWEYLAYSKLILCDLTYKRPNCFIEYGFALAKGKHIILAIDESEGKTPGGRMKVPFDTLTQKYSFWRKEWLTNDTYKEKLIEFKSEIQERIKMKLSILDAESKI